MTHETLMPVDAMEASKTPENLERYRLISIGSIAIFGEEGAGKSNLSEALAQALNARLLQGGQIVRELTGGTHGTIGYLERPVSVDKNFDQQQIDLMREATPDDPLVNESRLSGLMIRINPDIRAVAICLTAPAKKRMSRIRKRALEEWESKKDQLLQIYLNNEIPLEEFEDMGQKLVDEKGQLTIAKIHEKEKKRREEDIRQWTEAWSELGGKDPLNPGTKINGQKLHDLTISTGKRSKAETLRFVLNWLLENGHIERAQSIQDINDSIMEENKTNGYDLIEESPSVASGLDKGETNTRSPHSDRHPNHPSRRRKNRESVA